MTLRGLCKNCNVLVITGLTEVPIDVFIVRNIKTPMFVISEKLMDLERELFYRLSCASDFLVSCWNGEQFVHAFQQEHKPSKTIHVTHSLQAISTLITLSEFLERKNLRLVADAAWDQFSANVFATDDKTSFLVQNDESLLLWNVYMTLIHLKRNELELAMKFGKSILPCIGPETVSPVYPADFSKPPAYLAEAMISLLYLHDRTHDDLWADAAAYMAETLLKQGIVYNQYEIWALTMLHQIEPDSRYLVRAQRQMQAFNKLTVSAMTSLFAACTQQACFASQAHSTWIDPEPEKVKNYQLSVLNQQIALQVDKDKTFGWSPEFYGAFILRKTRPDIRLDYVTHNAMAILMYLSYLTNSKSHAII
jgi:hypothetical protein